MDFQTVAIIVVQYGVPEITARCLESLDEHVPDEITRIFISNEKGENLGAIWNRTISELEPKIKTIILLNSDTQVTDGWLEEILGGFGQEEKIGAVGPSTNYCGSEQKITDNSRLPRYGEIGMLSGFCLAIDREAFNAVRGFREDFPFYGQDTEFCRRLRRFGFKLYWACHAFVHHEGAASLRAAVTEGRIESEKAERDKGTAAMAKFGLAIPEVLELAADYLYEEGELEIRGTYPGRFLDLELMAERRGGIKTLEVGEIPKAADRATLVWNTENYPVSPTQLERDRERYRWVVVFEDVESFERKGLGDLLKEYWPHVHLETVNGQRFAVCAPKRQTVCLTILAKNEGQTIERTILSYEWDRVVVGIDNATTDDTRERCLAAGVKPEDIWTFDFTDMETLKALKAKGLPASKWDEHTGFGKLRNISMERAREQDFMIFIDGHEFIESRSTCKLDHVLAMKGPRFEVIEVLICHGPREFLHPRMMRTDRGIKHTSVFHNQIRYDRENAAAEPTIRVLHDRPEPITRARRQQVESMNTFYFRELYEENPEDERATFYYAQSLAQTDQPEKAIEVWAAFVDRGPDKTTKIYYDTQRYQAAIYIAQWHMKHGNFVEAWRWCMKCWRFDCYRNEHVVMLGDIAKQQKQLHESAHWLRLATHYRRPASTMFSHQDGYGPKPYLSLAQTYFWLDDWQGATATLEACLRLFPDEQNAQSMLTEIARYRRARKSSDDPRIDAVSGGRDLAAMAT